MLEQHTLEEIKRLMESWTAAYKNALDLNKELAAIDAKRAIIIDKMTDEEKKARIAEDTLNAMLEGIEDEEEVAQVQALAKEELADTLMLGMVE